MIKFYLLAIQFWTFCNAYNILTISLFPSPSHNNVIVGIANALAEAGHKVTLVSTTPARFNHKNVTIVELKWGKLKSTAVSNTVERFKLSTIETIIDMYHLGYQLCEKGLAEPEFQDLTYKAIDPNVDLVIFSNFNSDCVLAAVHHWNIPIIAVGTSGSTVYVNEMVGALAPYATVPHLFLGASGKMNIWERFRNIRANLLDRIYRKWFYFSHCDTIIKKYIPDAPGLEYLILNSVDFVFVNSHVATRVPLSLPPNMIEIGGISLQRGKGNSKEVEHFLNSAPNGVIFFSIGTNTNSADVPKPILDAIINVFSKFRVIWKSDSLKISTPNLLVGKWFSQQDILAHPNCRLFITHGGLLSLTEAIFNGVPMLGIPLFNDQFMNIDFAVSNGFATTLNFENITEKSLEWAIQEAFRPEYRENAVKFSRILQDNYQSQASKVVYWSEYVIRYKGAKHLRQNGINMPLYQFLLFDIAGLLSICILVLIYFVLYSYRKFKKIQRIAKIKIN